MKEILALAKRYRRWLWVGIVGIAILISFINRLTRQDQVTPQPTDSPIETGSPIGTASSNPTPSSVPSSNSSPSATAQVLSTDPAAYPSLDSSDQAIYYYDQDASVFKKLDLATKQTRPLSDLLSFVNEAFWSADHQSLILKTINDQGNRVSNPLYQEDIDPGEIVVGSYNLATKQFTRLNKYIQSIGFVGSNHIVYQYKDSKYNNLSIADPDGKNWKNIATFKDEATIITTRTTALAQATNQHTVTRYSSTGATVETFTVPEEFKLSQSVWAEQGKEALYWVADNSGVIIKQLDNSNTKTLWSLSKKPDQLAILWDNNKGVVYLTSLDGIQQLPVSTK